MKIEFEEEFAISAREAYGYFRTPADWPRLFPAFAGAVERGDGWYAVSFRGFPFPLVTRITRDDPGTGVEWTFSGFWSGEGRVELEETARGTIIRGYEVVSPRGLWWLGPAAERLFLEARFRAVWEGGWRRLRRRAHAGDSAEPSAH
jgi:hypothetical protein